jgi:hypothetical protein
MDIEELEYEYKERVSRMTVDGGEDDEVSKRKVREQIVPLMLKIMKHSEVTKTLSKWNSELVPMDIINKQE